MIIITKCHAEYAGKGMEYSWGYSNKSGDNFIKIVDKCISRNTITTRMVKKFSKRARGYMVGYKVLESDAMKENNKPAELLHCMSQVSCH